MKLLFLTTLASKLPEMLSYGKEVTIKLRKQSNNNQNKEVTTILFQVLNLFQVIKIDILTYLNNNFNK